MNEDARCEDAANMVTALFLQAIVGKVMHMRAPDPVPERLCSLRTTRSSDVLGGLHELGSYEKVRTWTSNPFPTKRWRMFCREALRRAGIPPA